MVNINLIVRLGSWIASHEAAIQDSYTLESNETRLEDGPEREAFLAFMRSMLKWMPEQRKTARELLDDTWLQE